MALAIRSTLTLLTLAVGLSAQTYYHLPAGHDLLEGNANNTIPFWSTSATYQQVHDNVDIDRTLGGLPVAVFNSLNLRKDNSTSSAPGRTVDVQITLGQSSSTAATASSVYANNLGASPTVVLPFTTVNLPALTNLSGPNPIGWTYPFSTPFFYVTGPGSLCWEMRTMNASTNANASMDAAQGTSTQSSAVYGTGCTATGQASPAQISTRSLSMTSGQWRNVMTFGAPASPSVFLIGFGHTTIPLPGFCSSLEFGPVTTVSGSTDGAGAWDFTYTFGSLVGFPPVELLGQFAFVDAGLTSGVGLSNSSSFTLPPLGNSQVTRIYTAPFGGGAGSETAATGTVGRGFGLVTIFGM